MSKKWYVAGIFLMMFTGAICTTTQGVMLTHYIDYYQLESFEQGLMSAFQSGGNLAALLLIGILQKYLSKNTILLITAVAIPTVFFLFGTNLPFFIFLTGYGIYGIAFGFLDSLASSIMVDLYPEKSSMYMNLLHGIYGLGGLTGPILLRFLELREIPWQRILFLMGCIALVASLLYGIGTIFMRKNSFEREQTRPIHWQDIVHYFRDRNKRILFICAFLYGAHQIGITVWIARYISEYLHTPRWGALALSVFWVCIAAARLILPHFGISNIRLLFLGNLVSGLAIMAGVITGNGFFMMICVGISGFAEGTILPLNLDTACHWEMENTSIGSSMVLLAHYIGFMITPVIMGKLIADTSIMAGMLFPAVLSVIAAFLVRTCKVQKAA